MNALLSLVSLLGDLGIKRVRDGDALDANRYMIRENLGGEHNGVEYANCTEVMVVGEKLSNASACAYFCFDSAGNFLSLTID